jgi:hypothetical protein
MRHYVDAHAIPDPFVCASTNVQSGDDCWISCVSILPDADPDALPLRRTSFRGFGFCSHLLAVSSFLLIQSAGGIGSLTIAREKARQTHQAFEIFFHSYSVYAGCVLLSAIIIAYNLDICYHVILGISNPLLEFPATPLPHLETSFSRV